MPTGGMSASSPLGRDGDIASFIPTGPPSHVYTHHVAAQQEQHQSEGGPGAGGMLPSHNSQLVLPSRYQYRLAPVTERAGAPVLSPEVESVADNLLEGGRTTSRMSGASIESVISPHRFERPRPSFRASGPHHHFVTTTSPLSDDVLNAAPSHKEAHRSSVPMSRSPVAQGGEEFSAAIPRLGGPTKHSVSTVVSTTEQAPPPPPTGCFRGPNSSPNQTISFLTTTEIPPDAVPPGFLSGGGTTSKTVVPMSARYSFELRKTQSLDVVVGGSTKKGPNWVDSNDALSATSSAASSGPRISGKYLVPQTARASRSSRVVDHEPPGQLSNPQLPRSRETSVNRRPEVLPQTLCPLDDVLKCSPAAIDAGRSVENARVLMSSGSRSSGEAHLSEENQEDQREDQGSPTKRNSAEIMAAVSRQFSAASVLLGAPAGSSGKNSSTTSTPAGGGSSYRSRGGTSSTVGAPPHRIMSVSSTSLPYCPSPVGVAGTGSNERVLLSNPCSSVSRPLGGGEKLPLSPLTALGARKKNQTKVPDATSVGASATHERNEKGTRARPAGTSGTMASKASMTNTGSSTMATSTKASMTTSRKPRSPSSTTLRVGSFSSEFVSGLKQGSATARTHHPRKFSTTAEHRLFSPPQRSAARNEEGREPAPAKRRFVPYDSLCADLETARGKILSTSITEPDHGSSYGRGAMVLGHPPTSVGAGTPGLPPAYGLVPPLGGLFAPPTSSEQVGPVAPAPPTSALLSTGYKPYRYQYLPASSAMAASTTISDHTGTTSSSLLVMAGSSLGVRTACSGGDLLTAPLVPSSNPGVVVPPSVDRKRDHASSTSSTGPGRCAVAPAWAAGGGTSGIDDAPPGRTRSPHSAARRRFSPYELVLHHKEKAAVDDQKSSIGPPVVTPATAAPSSTTSSASATSNLLPPRKTGRSSGATSRVSSVDHQVNQEIVAARSRPPQTSRSYNTTSGSWSSAHAAQEMGRFLAKEMAEEEEAFRRSHDRLVVGIPSPAPHKSLGPPPAVSGSSATTPAPPTSASKKTQTSRLEPPPRTAEIIQHEVVVHKEDAAQRPSGSVEHGALPLGHIKRMMDRVVAAQQQGSSRRATFPAPVGTRDDAAGTRRPRRDRVPSGASSSDMFEIPTTTTSVASTATGFAGHFAGAFASVHSAHSGRQHHYPHQRGIRNLHRTGGASKVAADPGTTSVAPQQRLAGSGHGTNRRTGDESAKANRRSRGSGQQGHFAARQGRVAGAAGRHQQHEEQFSPNGPGNGAKRPPVDWSVQEVSQWLFSKELSKAVVSVLTAEAIDGRVLSTMTEKDLESLGITKFGHRRSLMLKLRELCTQHRVMRKQCVMAAG